MKDVIQGLKGLQKMINDFGLGGAMLALPSPRTLLLSNEPVESHIPEALFDQIVTEPEIVEVSRDLFAGGYFNVAVSEAFKVLDIYVKAKVDEKEESGVKLMQGVFSVSNPKLVWSDRKTRSEQDAHRGYSLLYQGGFTGIRNPTSHEVDWISEPEEALDAIMIAQHLLRKAKVASPPPQGPIDTGD